MECSSVYNFFVFKGFIKGEIICYLRNISNENILFSILCEFEMYFLKRGYSEKEIKISI